MFFLYELCPFINNSNRNLQRLTKGMTASETTVPYRAKTKHACLNKCEPNFWLSWAVTLPIIIVSWWNFQDVKLKFIWFNVMNFIDIRQIEGSIICLRIQHIYLALYRILPNIRVGAGTDLMFDAPAAMAVRKKWNNWNDASAARYHCIPLVHVTL